MKAKIGEYAIISNSKKQILIMQLNNPEHTWHFPGGRLNIGDEAVEGLRREVKEETGLNIFDIEPIHTQIFTEEKKYGVFFTAKTTEPIDIKISFEHRDFRWITKKELDNINFWQHFYKKLVEKAFERLD